MYTKGPRTVCGGVCQAPCAARTSAAEPSDADVRASARHALRLDFLVSVMLRMRNSGALLFVVGIVLLSQGVDAEANRVTSVGSFGIGFIVLGTVTFLWGWKLLQVEK